MMVLDLYCGAGGSSEGYYRAGYGVIGIDREKQRNYPFCFIEGEVVEFLEGNREWIRGSIDLVHASPPCQRYSKATKFLSNQKVEANSRRVEGHDDLVRVTRELLIEVGVPYVIENVPGAPLYRPIRLCGVMFGLGVYRHRLFECSLPVAPPRHPKHTVKVSALGRRVEGEGAVMSVVGHFSGVERARVAMGIDWMSRNELAQAVPPAYTRYIGEQLWDRIKGRDRDGSDKVE